MNSVNGSELGDFLAAVVNVISNNTVAEYNVLGGLDKATYEVEFRMETVDGEVLFSKVRFRVKEI